MAVDPPEPSSEGCAAGSVDEDCFNSKDDDCDHKVDCEDDDCEPAAYCVPAGTAVGALIAASAATCPAGFGGEVVDLHRDLKGSAECSGCSCGAAGPTSCSAELSLYVDGGDAEWPVAQCEAGTVAGTGRVSSFTCPAEPIAWSYLPGVRGSQYGISVGSITADSPGCAPSGTAHVAAPTWGAESRFCTAQRLGRGCSKGLVCAPRPASGILCSENASECQDTQQEWYTGFKDSRICGACSCQSTGASCAGVSVQLGNDWACTGRARLGVHSKVCEYFHAPNAQLVGSPTPARCEATSPISGELVPTGARRLCCK